MNFAFHALSLIVAVVLLAFTARRALFLLAAIFQSPIPNLQSHRPTRPPAHLPSILVLIPARNESRSLPSLFNSLGSLDYPRDRLTVVVVDDGSTDDTAQVANEWARGKDWAHLLSLPANVGKPAALNEALNRFPQGDLIAVYDSDSLPAPDSLARLARAFDDLIVGAANGFLLPLNSLASPAAYYSTVELFVHQRITMAAKDRLRLAPAILGSNCVYRRSALVAVGAFRRGLLLEDSDLTLSLERAGWQARFVADAIAQTSVPQSLAGYWKQHIRWARGFQQVVALQGWESIRDPRAAPGLRLELLAFALGYFDRLALLAAAALTALDLLRPGLAGFPLWLWLVYFGLPLAQIVAAIRLAPETQPAQMYLYLIVVPFFFAFDVAMAVWATTLDALKRPAQWTVTERPTVERDDTESSGVIYE